MSKKDAESPTVKKNNNIWHKRFGNNVHVEEMFPSFLLCGHSGLVQWHKGFASLKKILLKCGNVMHISIKFLMYLT